MPVTSRTHCPLCSESASFSYKESCADSASGTRYDLFECPVCTGQFFEPLKNPGAEWYEHDERYAGRNHDPILAAQWNHRTTIDRLSTLRGAVLDVGCGVGNFLAYAQSKGWKCTGIDFDHDAIEAGKKTFGLAELSVSDIHAFCTANPDRQFDLVTFFDVFEHVDDHEKFLAAVHALTKEGGYIALTTPHRAHAKFLMPADVPPRHLTRWDEKSLAYVLARHGFKVTYLKGKGEGIRFYILKLRFRYGKRFSMGLVSKARASVSSSKTAKRSQMRVWAAQVLASAKDAILFGIPAFFLWLFFLPTRKRFVSLYALAQKIPSRTA